MKLHYFLFLTLGFGLMFTSCKEEVDDPPSADPFSLADFSNGGIMYDKFWASESDYDENNSYNDSVNAYGNFFRCKQCHGWDGLGTAGAYISRGAKTSRPHVSDLNLFQLAQTKSAEELFDGIKQSENRRDFSYSLAAYDPDANALEGDKMPNYSQVLTDAQIWDIVKFLKDNMFDVADLYDASTTGSYPTGSIAYSNVGKDGNAVSGQAYYTSNCEVCHGVDGTTLDLEGKTAGAFVRSKPYEVQHKVKYGQLGSAMKGEFDITKEELKDLYKALSNTTNFPD